MTVERVVKRGRPRKYGVGAKRDDNTSLTVTRKHREYISKLTELNNMSIKDFSSEIIMDILSGKFDYLLTPISGKDDLVSIATDKALTHKLRDYLSNHQESPSEVLRKVLDKSMIMEKETIKTVGGYELGVTILTSELKKPWLLPTQAEQENKFFGDAHIQLDTNSNQIVIYEKSTGVRSISQMEELKQYKDNLLGIASQLQKALDEYVIG